MKCTTQHLMESVLKICKSLLVICSEVSPAFLYVADRDSITQG